ncbi:DUF1819 family protein [Candidatus Thiothrix anitrata]|uniref:DUF1819 family protein n=1 Tax=Candidatus Thiothrix anitrata TaxID=2823902 RepID=A0ABX7X1X1_9GAMM|nr:DUF1819 family protein [Candidatus Thiothrix anitrata]QTR48778.1 DUF1819 family protein [Candidatus Thiothrix anitrata]
MKPYPYSFSFTSSAAAIQTSVALAAVFMRLENWRLVREQAIRENMFQARTVSYAERLFREIASRLQTLNHAEINLLVNGNPTEQQQLVWLAICQRYAPIRDFAQEVLVEHYHQSRSQLAEQEFDAFYHRKAEWQVELERLAPATLAKARRVVFRMLKECGLLNTDNLILPQALSTGLIVAMGDNAKRYRAIFPGVTYPHD